MSAPSSPHASPRKGKFILAKVLLLDDVEHVFQIPVSKIKDHNLLLELVDY